MLRALAVLPGGLRIETDIGADGRYRLACHAGARLVVLYTGERGTHRRRAHGRASAYAFRSVEQLRYDFERDVADAQHPG